MDQAIVEWIFPPNEDGGIPGGGFPLDSRRHAENCLWCVWFGLGSPSGSTFRGSGMRSWTALVAEM
jgi:hypothetical protein